MQWKRARAGRVRTAAIALALSAAVVTGCAASSVEDTDSSTATAASAARDDIDVVLSADGCSTDRIDVPASKPPLVRMVNDSDTEMVFTVPRFARTVFLAPGEHGELPVNPFIVGEFPFFCHDLPTHIAAGGASAEGEPEWPLDPAILEGVSLTSGMLAVEQHQQPGQ